MKITGQEIETGVREWIKDELKNAPNKEYELGKFFFSVSTGTLGILFVAEQIGNNARWDLPLVTGFALLLLSIGLSLYMVVPKNWKIGDDTDLFDWRDSIVKRIVREAYGWFALWAISVVFGLWAALT